MGLHLLLLLFLNTEYASLNFRSAASAGLGPRPIDAVSDVLLIPGRVADEPVNSLNRPAQPSDERMSANSAEPPTLAEPSEAVPISTVQTPLSRDSSSDLHQNLQKHFWLLPDLDVSAQPQGDFVYLLESIASTTSVTWTRTIVDLMINDQGKVIDVQLVEGEASAEWEKAKALMLLWPFDSAIRNGRKVNSLKRVEWSLSPAMDAAFDPSNPPRGTPSLSINLTTIVPSLPK